VTLSPARHRFGHYTTEAPCTLGAMTLSPVGTALTTMLY